ncbi:MAG: hypothetical protein ACT4P5_18655 [Armatimonadota bacterium]
MRVLRPKLRPVLILAVLAVIVIGLMQWVGKRPTAKEATPPPQRPAPLVRTTVVDPTLLVEQSSFPGEVRASATADVISRIAGRLGAVLVKEGSFVGAGSLVSHRRSRARARGPAGGRGRPGATSPPGADQGRAALS